jgi:probable rRNA maturation factor
MPLLIGDVVICPEVAWRQAPEHSAVYEDELALLLVHGILHLLGMDHEEDAEAAMMETLEQQLLAAHHREPGASP